jgi:archaellum biogenesis protein FlaJ (TadC family)
MKLLYLALLALASFVAIWIFFVMPAERKHHERKLEIVRKKIEMREAGKDEQPADSER